MKATTLDTKYLASSGRVHLTGLQALVRLLIEQRHRDRDAGLDTAGYVSGYRGSPLGGFDQELARASDVLESLGIVAAPGINEDLAATAVWGTQQVVALGDATKDGVFGVWYGKGPGVDRCGDVFRHGNTAGTARHGGVLLLAGDDHAAKSSTVAHQSEFAFVDAMIPVLHPSTLAEFVLFGLYGIALSRYSGLWVAMKLTGTLVESAGTVDLDAIGATFVVPADLPSPDVAIRWPDAPVLAEERLHRAKWPALAAWVRANPIDRVFHRTPLSRIGIVATGKAWLDVRQALAELDIDDTEASCRGLTLCKVGMSWPIDADAMRTFAEGLETILVVEDKRALIETQLRDALYELSSRPAIVGKRDAHGASLLPATLELDASQVLGAFERVFGWRRTDATSPAAAGAAPLARTPYFCSGCPHNTSTVVPEDALALGGIGCHAMAIFTPGRRTATYTQMGGEGASWIGMAPFSKRRHVFQNLGDGTYFHSGSLGIRAAVAADVDVTFKILYNEAVAMTGGQPVDGALSLASLVAQLRAEGVATIVITTDDVVATRAALGRRDVEVAARDDLDAVQRRLAATAGVTALIHAQMCAAEKRRKRRRGLLAPPTVAVHIAAEVCEGCGDCGKQSGCLSIQPRVTPSGQKRRIDATTCNVDLSCLRGFCPSFVTIENVRPSTRGGARPSVAPPEVAEPTSAIGPAGVHRVLIAGVGGTGVTTLGAVLAMAAHLDGLVASVHDMTGLAQKGGPVYSHLVMARDPLAMTTPVIPAGHADVLIGCDLVVAASSESLGKLAAAVTAVVSTHVVVTSDFARNPSSVFPSAQLLRRVQDAGNHGVVSLFDAHRIASDLVGSGEAANFVLAGAAWQAGGIPIALASIVQAIAVNGVAVEANRRAFAWGRAWVASPDRVLAALDRTNNHDAGSTTVASPETLRAALQRHRAHLTAYQGTGLVSRFDAKVGALERVARERVPDRADTLVSSFAEAWARALAPKDEYEVARLLTHPRLLAELAAAHDTGGAAPRVAFHLAPPLFARIGSDGRPRKRRYGSWVLPVLRVLARGRTLRGTWLDPFRRGDDRLLEAKLRDRVAHDADLLVRKVDAHNVADCIALAAVSLDVKGYGPVKAASWAAQQVAWAALEERIEAPGHATPAHADAMAADA